MSESRVVHEFGVQCGTSEFSLVMTESRVVHEFGVQCGTLGQNRMSGSML